jgi:molybdopterin-binding protein
LSPRRSRDARHSDVGHGRHVTEIALLPCGVPQYRISQAAELLGVSADTVRRWADAGRVKATQGSRGRRFVDGADLARLAVELAGGQGSNRPRGQSARNRFQGIVTRVTKDGVAAQVEVQAGPHRFVALITREAADELELEPGMLADAVVKATNVGIEVASES